MTEIKRIPITTNQNNELNVFNNPEFGKLRTIMIDNEPWFVGKDVATALEYSNTRDAIAKHVDDEDKTSVVIRDGIGNPNKVIINESGVYSLILRSKLPAAKKFKRWVTHEVIPSIRKHGAYMTDDVIEKAITNPDFIIKLATQLKNERQKSEELSAQVEELKPKADYTDKVLKSNSVFPIRQIANEYDMTAQQMNKLLVEYGVIYHSKNRKYYCLYKKYRGMGYVASVTVKYEKADGTIGTSVNIGWTQSGRKFIHDLLAEHGILPVQEKNSKLGILVEKFLEEREDDAYGKGNRLQKG